MRFILLILLLTFFAPLQCSFYRSNSFFVTRRHTQEAICIEPIPSNDPVPTFDLDKMKIPQDVGFKYWDWLVGWQWQNDTIERGGGGNRVFIAGNQPFHLVRRNNNEWVYVCILASNVTLWLADYDQPRGSGLLFELDHLNETTKLKDTTLKYCDQNPEVEGAKCTILDYKNGTNHLNDGNHWTSFRIKKKYPTGVEMNEKSYGKEKPVGQCTWNDTKISNPFPSDDFAVFAKTHQRNAAFYTENKPYPDLANNNEMKRNYTKRSSGKFCVQVYWVQGRSNDSIIELMQVKNLVSGRVQPATNTTQYYFGTYFKWNHLDAGEYEITLRVDKRQPLKIDLCHDYNSKIWRTWVQSIPKAITKCQFSVGYPFEFSAGSSSPPDPKLKPKWTLEEWAYVCDRLGIGSNDTEVPIKFCNEKGCNFSKCPHLQHEPPYIFDF